MSLPSPSVLTTVLATFTLAQKLDRLALLCPTDATAIELLVDDCLVRRWPECGPVHRFAISDPLE